MPQLGVDAPKDEPARGPQSSSETLGQNDRANCKVALPLGTIYLLHVLCDDWLGNW